ncbi:MAG: tRNA 2-thiouridine(34) synthase MnmA [Deltaproteobacteria bacterium]|nr:tRNA 2-thiouridine(34) synthase MnmA [Deltaproteobacteria bacterium]
MKPSSVVVALSGGVDSSLAAALLMRAGWEVQGLHFNLPAPEIKNRKKLSLVRKVAEHLDIPLSVLDLEDTFIQQVVEPFRRAYLKGMTPNPCVQCNPGIKFRELLHFAEGQGIERLATGHYARLRGEGTSGVSLWRGKDPRKEQSYFLHRLDLRHLSRALFPLGEMTKPEVRRLAVELGLPTKEEPESQEICFLGDRDYRSFLEQEEGRKIIEKGNIVDGEGQKVGEHMGTYRYTIGQRHGLGIASPRPYYVMALNPEKNLVVVGRKEELFSSHVEMASFHWIGEGLPQVPVRVMAQIRYRHEPAPGRLEVSAGGDACFDFEEAQWGVTPGQALVCYEGGRVLGGGWIEKAEGARGLNGF